MNYEFLHDFEKRMKNVGLYAMLMKNSFQKGTWKLFGFETLDEQINLIFTVLCFIMEQSLKEEICTMDDIASFVDSINHDYFKKRIGYEQCKELSEFIINVILSDEGKAMYFRGYNFEKKEYELLHVSFVKNRVVYIDEDIRRTSYSLTSDGYSMMLGTLELEGNMKLSFHEMIFKLHLEKASYEKAVMDVKNLFNELKIRIQNMQEAMTKMRRNALEYSVKEYKKIMEDNMISLEQTNAKYEDYRQNVLQRVMELEDKEIDLSKLNEKDLENLNYLNVIESYLNRSIDEIQQLMLLHFDVKNLYAAQLESISQMSMVKRYSLRTDVYEKVLSDASLLHSMDDFLRPLFNAPINKIYNVNKAFQTQKLKVKEETDDDILDFNEEVWEVEQHEKIQKRLRAYRECLSSILIHANQIGGVTLRELEQFCTQDEDLKQKLIPTMEIFREVVIELLKSKEIDVVVLKEEQAKNIVEQPMGFQLNVSLLEVIKEEESLQEIKKIGIRKLEDSQQVCFEHVAGEDGKWHRVLASNVKFEIVTENLR